MKKCKICKEIKPIDQFYIRILAPKKDGTRGFSRKSICRECYVIERVCTKYRISSDFYLTMIRQQNNVCKICNLPETTTDSRYGKIRVLSVDHCHKTNKIRGLLCENCNRALGLFKDSTILLDVAINYLTGSL